MEADFIGSVRNFSLLIKGQSNLINSYAFLELERAIFYSLPDWDRGVFKKSAVLTIYGLKGFFSKNCLS